MATLEPKVKDEPQRCRGLVDRSPDGSSPAAAIISLGQTIVYIR